MGVEDHSSGTRGTAATQALVSAALVLPTAMIWYLRTWPAGMDWPTDQSRIWSLAWSVVLGGYFVTVVAVLARSAARRLPAVIMGVAATVIDVGAAAAISFSSYSDPILWIDRVLMVVTLILYVASWGVARRRYPRWVTGLAPAVVIAILATALSASGWLYTAFGTAWIAYWAVWIGGFLLGCLVCWGFDAMGSAAATGTDAPTAAPPPVQSGGSPAEPQTNTMAIAALVSSLVFAPLGIVFGHVALRQIKRNGDDGLGLAIAGLVIGYVTAVLMVLFMILVVVYFVVMFSRLDDVSNAAPASIGVSLAGG